MLRKTNIICLAVILLIFIKVGEVDATPYLSTNFYCLVDGDTGQVIYSKAQDEKRAVASTTKMMTAILTTEYAQLSEIATISPYADKTPEFTIGLKAGQEVEVGELLKVALIRSSNDAAVALGEHIAGDERLFGHLMSKKAFVIGAVNTHFVNASGLPNQDHYSTAYDLTIIGRYLLTKKDLAQIVAMPEAVFKHPGYSEPLTIRNTNGLMWYPGINGIKTGSTDLAGKCLVASASREGRNLVAVALKSGDRNGDCKKLLDYGFEQAKYVQIIDKTEAFKQFKISNANKPYMELFPSQDIYLWQADNTLNIEKKVRMNYALEAPIKAGTKLGYVDIYVNNKLVDSIALISRENINKNNIIITRLKEILIK